MKTTDFTIDTVSKLGVGMLTKRSRILDTPKDTFEKIWRALPERLFKSWISISWTVDGITYEVSRSHWVETKFDFDESVTITPDPGD